VLLGEPEAKTKEEGSKASIRSLLIYPQQVAKVLLFVIHLVIVQITSSL